MRGRQAQGARSAHPGRAYRHAYPTGSARCTTAPSGLRVGGAAFTVRERTGAGIGASVRTTAPVVKESDGGGHLLDHGPAPGASSPDPAQSPPHRPYAGYAPAPAGNRTRHAPALGGDTAFSGICGEGTVAGQRPDEYEGAP